MIERTPLYLSFEEKNLLTKGLAKGISRGEFEKGEETTAWELLEFLRDELS